MKLEACYHHTFILLISYKFVSCHRNGLVMNFKQISDLMDPSPVILSLQLCYAGKESFSLDMLIGISRYVFFPHL